MSSAPSDRGIFGFALWKEVLIALILGVIIGLSTPEYGETFKIIGTVFILLIKMIVGPLIFFALITGITSLGDISATTRIGSRGIMLYLGTSFAAISLGLVLATLMKPGIGVDLQLDDIPTTTSNAEAAQFGVNFLLNLIPQNIVSMFAEDFYIQIVIFSVFAGIVINMLGAKGHPARDICRAFSVVVFKMIELIVRLAAPAVFGFTYWMIATQGIDILETLLYFIFCFVLASFIQALVFCSMIFGVAGLSPLPFIRKMGSVMLLAFSTSSSKAVLANVMHTSEHKLGISPQTTNFMLPLGAAMNMDGTAIYLGIAAVFFAQVFGISLNYDDYIVLILVCTLGSMGAGGIPSGSIIFMGMVLNAVGLPIEGIGVLLGVDRLLDMIRTTLNVTGDATIALVVDSLEKKHDTKRYYD